MEACDQSVGYQDEEVAEVQPHVEDQGNQHTDQNIVEVEDLSGQQDQGQPHACQMEPQIDLNLAFLNAVDRDTVVVGGTLVPAQAGTFTLLQKSSAAPPKTKRCKSLTKSLKSLESFEQLKTSTTRLTGSYGAAVKQTAATHHTASSCVHRGGKILMVTIATTSTAAEIGRAHV